MPLENEDIVAYPVCRNSVDEIVAHVTEWLDAPAYECRTFACINPHCVEIAAQDEQFHAALLDADFLTPDGIGVVHASRLFGGHIRRRVTGMDVFEGVTAAMNARGGGSCFFLGSTEETLAGIRSRMAADYPRVAVAGTLSPPFRPRFTPTDDRAMIDAVNRARPDVLWVGLTAPKQEKWLAAHRAELEVKFAGPIGAAFDFFVGNIRRAGPFWQDLGLEWLPRLLQEPRRLWRRSLVSAPRFFVRCARYRLTAGRGRRPTDGHRP